MKKKLMKAVATTALCGAMMFGTTITAFAGGGEEIDDPMTEPIYTPVIEQETEEEKEPEAFTPDGNAELVDEATDEDEKLFYTFVTKNDNYFYLVIDKAREQDNVYMLNLIDEEDLMALMAEQEENANPGMTDKDKNNVTLKPEAGVEDIPDETENPPAEESPVEVKSDKTNSSASLLIVLLVLGGGGAGAFYYLKFVKGKKEDFNMEDDLDFYDDEDYVNEDETEETVASDEPDEEVGEIEEDI